LQKRIEKNQIQNVEGNALLHSPYDAGGSESYAQWRWTSHHPGVSWTTFLFP